MSDLDQVVTLRQAITGFIAAQRRAGRSANTLRWYGFWFDQLTDYLYHKPIDKVTLDDLRYFIDETIKKKRAATTIHGAQIVTKAFFKWCVNEGLLAQNPAARLEVNRLPKRIPDALDMSEVLKLLDCAAGTESPERNRALIAFMAETGFRLSEVVNLKLKDLDLEKGLAYCIGKGNKQRHVPYGDVTDILLRKWLEVRDLPSDSVFGLKGAGIRMLLDRLGSKAGMKVSPHKLRRTAATMRAVSGAEVIALQAIFGWESADMARKYVNFAMVNRMARATSPMDRIITIDRRGQL